MNRYLSHRPRWTPFPMSVRDFPLGVRNLTVETPDGDDPYIIAEAQMMSVNEMFPAYDDPDMIGTAFLGARQRLFDQLTAALIESHMVADARDWELNVIVTARVKAWPAIPGLTTPGPDTEFDAD